MHKRLYLFYNQILRLSLLFVLLFLSMKNSKANIHPQLPDSIDGWTVGEQNLLNDKKSLYDYIDGGAELYISYGFTSALSIKYIKSDQPDVVVEIFNMVNSKNAYGVFSHTRYEEDYTFGQGSQYIGGVLFFWKNNFFVSIMTTEETDESKKLINDLGWIISEMIKGEGDKPEILDLLPLNGLEKAGVLYFHHYIWLNSFYYIADENFFLIDNNTDAVLAKYGSPENRSYLLIIQYQDKQVAFEAYSNFLEKYFPEGKHVNILQLEDHTWMSAELVNNTFFGIFNGESEERVSRLLSEAKFNYQKANVTKKIINP